MGQIDIESFNLEVAKYLEQYMKTSNDIDYITQLRAKIVADSGDPELAEAIPKPFPLSKTIGKYVMNNPLNDYFAEYLESRGITDADSTVLTQEADRFAKLLLTSVTEIAIVIAMIDVALVEWIKRTPHPARLLAKIYANTWSTIYKRKNNVPAVIVTFYTAKKIGGELVIKFIDEIDKPKLLSETGKHITADYSTSDSSIKIPNISWEELPKFIKSKILTDE